MKTQDVIALIAIIGLIVLAVLDSLGYHLSATGKHLFIGFIIIDIFYLAGILFEDLSLRTRDFEAKITTKEDKEKDNKENKN